jgi:hypothetical protein
MVACALMTLTNQLVSPILRKTDLRDIKVAEDTVVTIDLEDLKRNMANRFNPCEFNKQNLYFGA